MSDKYVKVDTSKGLHVLVDKQKGILIKDMHKNGVKKCCGERDLKFGIVFIQGADKVVNGYSLECQICKKSWMRVFDPPYSLKLVTKDIDVPDLLVKKDDASGAEKPGEDASS